MFCIPHCIAVLWLLDRTFAASVTAGHHGGKADDCSRVKTTSRCVQPLFCVFLLQIGKRTFLSYYCVDFTAADVTCVVCRISVCTNQTDGGRSLIAWFYGTVTVNGRHKPPLWSGRGFRAVEPAETPRHRGQLRSCCCPGLGSLLSASSRHIKPPTHLCFQANAPRKQPRAHLRGDSGQDEAFSEVKTLHFAFFDCDEFTKYCWLRSHLRSADYSIVWPVSGCCGVNWFEWVKRPLNHGTHCFSLKSSLKQEIIHV